MSDSVQPHRQQPTRLCRPWDYPGKNIRVGCHCLLLAIANFPSMHFKRANCLSFKSTLFWTINYTDKLSDLLDRVEIGITAFKKFCIFYLHWKCIAYPLPSPNISFFFLLGFFPQKPLKETKESAAMTGLWPKVGSKIPSRERRRVLCCWELKPERVRFPFVGCTSVECWNLSGVVKAFGWTERITAGSRLVITERCNHNIARLWRIIGASFLTVGEGSLKWKGIKIE